MRPLAALLLSTLAARAGAAPAAAPLAPPELRAAPRLALDRSGTALVAASALAAWGVGAWSGSGEAPGACRWCEPGGLDRLARAELRWRATDEAGRASDALRLAVPAGSAAALALLAAREGGGREVVEDVVAVGLALALTAPLTSAVKHGTARLRPEAWAAGGPRGEGDLHSFFSSHTSRAFAAAAAASQVARLRGRPGWRWLAALAFAGASATAWLRVAADQHWATDVLAGGAAGAAVGLAVPPLVLRRAGESGRPPATVLPAPGGIALAF